ncbi:MAG TPA: hypothetical protein VEG34_15095, partial [Thermoanaerobaculia bacterium]|nr:hypothetical protein [Thermoanaerobaculia bacterium]
MKESLAHRAQPAQLAQITTAEPPAVDRAHAAAPDSAKGARGRAADPGGARAAAADHRRRSGRIGQALTWLCGGALAFNLLLVIAILGLLAYNGMGYFWQRDLLELTLTDGRKLLGEVWEHEQVTAVAATEVVARDRYRMKTGNRDVDGLDFVWIDASEIAGRALPPQAMLLERREWGNFYGYMTELRVGDEVIARGPDAVWKAFEPLHAQKLEQWDEVRELEKGAIGDVNYELEDLRLDERRLALSGLPAGERARRQAELERRIAGKEAEYEQLSERLFALREEMEQGTLVVRTAAGDVKEVPVADVVRAFQPNTAGTLGKLGLNLSRLREFIFDDPRESNTEGGIFPAIFGTVMMVFIMS